MVHHIQIFNCLTFHGRFGIYGIKSLKYNVFFQLLLMSRTDIPNFLTLLEDRDPLTYALYKFILTHAQDSYLLSIWRLLLTLLVYVAFLIYLKAFFSLCFTSASFTFKYLSEKVR